MIKNSFIFLFRFPMRKDMEIIQMKESLVRNFRKGIKRREFVKGMILII